MDEGFAAVIAAIVGGIFVILGKVWGKQTPDRQSQESNKKAISIILTILWIGALAVALLGGDPLFTILVCIVQVFYCLWMSNSNSRSNVITLFCCRLHEMFSSKEGALHENVPHCASKISGYTPQPDEKSAIPAMLRNI